MTQREAFETWYCTNYWNFKHTGVDPQYAAKYFDETKNSYKHMDIDLAWQAWKAGQDNSITDTL